MKTIDILSYIKWKLIKEQLLSICVSVAAFNNCIYIYSKYSGLYSYIIIRFAFTGTKYDIPDEMTLNGDLNKNVEQQYLPLFYYDKLYSDYCVIFMLWYTGK